MIVSRHSWAKRVLPPVDTGGMLASMCLFSLIFLGTWCVGVPAESAAFGFAVGVLLITIATLEISREAGALVRYIQDWCFTFFIVGVFLVLLAQLGLLGLARSTFCEHLHSGGSAYSLIFSTGIAIIALMGVFATKESEESEAQVS